MGIGCERARLLEGVIDECIKSGDSVWDIKDTVDRAIKDALAEVANAAGRE